MIHITRRSFLALLALTPGLAFARTKAGKRAQTKFDSAISAQWQIMLAGIVGPYQSMLAIGDASRQGSLSTDYSSWTRHFTRKLTKSVNLPTETAIRNLSSEYQARVRKDFQFGRTVRLNGYILSQTEVEICAWVTNSIQPPV